MNVINARRQQFKPVLSPFLGIIPIIIFNLFMHLWIFLSPTLVTHNILPFFLLISLLSGHQVGTVILSHLCKRSYPMIHIPSWIAFTSGIVVTSFLQGYFNNIQLFGKHLNVQEFLQNNIPLLLQKQIVDFILWGVDISNAPILMSGESLAMVLVERRLLYGLLIITGIMYAWWVRQVIVGICGIFNIYCLRIKIIKK